MQSTMKVLQLKLDNINIVCVYYIPYNWKYWQALNLAIWSQTGHWKILDEFKCGGGQNLAGKDHQVCNLGCCLAGIVEFSLCRVLEKVRFEECSIQIPATCPGVANTPTLPAPVIPTTGRFPEWVIKLLCSFHQYKALCLTGCTNCITSAYYM